MNRNTIVTYSTGSNSITFSCKTPLWITEITNASGNGIEISETQGTGQVGSTLSSQSVQPRDITVNGVVIKDLEINRRGILDCILPGVTGRLTIEQNGESWYIEGTPSQTPEFSDGSSIQQFQFVLHCPYPYWRSTEDGHSLVAGLLPLFRFPCNLKNTWWISRYTGSLFTTVTNSGNVPLAFDLVLQAVTEVTVPEVYHVERGTFIRINRTLAAGEKVIVSTVYGRKGVVLTLADGTQANGFKYLDVESDLNMQLDPGENTIRYDAGNNREGLRVKIIAPRGVVAGV